MLLSEVVFLPLVFAFALWVLPQAYLRLAALVFAVFEFVFSLCILGHFDKTQALAQLTEQASWVPELGIRYFLGVDGLSLWLVLLTTLLLPVALFSMRSTPLKATRGFYACLFILQTALLGAFLSLDAVLFYVFFELSLVPAYLLVGIWGGPKRVAATTKFFMYTVAGSLLMLLGIIYMMFCAQDALGAMSSSLADWYTLHLPFVAGEFLNPQTILFFIFSLAFAIKTALFPFHSWVVDTYYEAPTEGLVLISGVMLKLGGYGFLRFVIPLFPEAAQYWSWLFLFLGVAGLIYAAFIAIVQPESKKLVAYSSISHMGYVMIGLFALNVYGLTGAYFQMLSHAVTIAALFILLEFLYRRIPTMEMKRISGLAKAMPLFAIFFVIVALATIAVPMSNGFVGEFLILLGAFSANKFIGSVAVLGVILGACYMLSMVKRVFFGAESELVTELRAKDLSLKEMLVLTPLIVLIFWMGIFPGHFLNWSKASLDHLVSDKDNYTIVRGQ
jgi:NADH-quinone oxidoreductase subunit M